MIVEQLRRKAFEKTSQRVKEALSRQDALIVHAVKTIDLVDKTSNLLFEKFRDWYAHYVPELSGFAPDAQDYLKIALLGARKNYSAQNIIKAVGGKEYADRLAVAVQQSAGADWGEEDLKQVQALGSKILELGELRKSVEKYVEELMRRECPNLSAVCGEMLGARLLAMAGSSKRLAELPSSTVQVLGAEKALFAHLQKGTNPPKHGVIFQYQALRAASPKRRGKIARRLAAKISIAAKVDYFKGEFCGDRLAKELEEYANK